MKLEKAIKALNELQRRVYMDNLLDVATSGPDYYDGWTREHFYDALFATDEQKMTAYQRTVAAMPNGPDQGRRASDSKQP